VDLWIVNFDFVVTLKCVVKKLICTKHLDIAEMENWKNVSKLEKWLMTIHSKNKVLAAALLLFLFAEMRNLEWSGAGAEWKQSFKSEEEFAAGLRLH